MAKKIKQLENYTETARAVADFKQKHAKLFAEFDALLVAETEAEAELKTYVRDEEKGNIANEFVRVTYSPAFRKFYDAEIVTEMLKPKERKALVEAKGISSVINSKTFEELVEKGVIPAEVGQEAFREEEQTARISIKEVK